MEKGYLSKKSIKKFLCVLPILVLLSFSFMISTHAQQLAYGSLSINSNPSGAKVFLDNEYKGVTPLNLKNIATGQYNIKMELPGYQEWTSAILVLPILTVTVSTDLVPLARTFGSISINSSPQGADVYLDDFYEGLTPLNIRNIETGQYSLKITLPGYQQWEDDISVLPSQVTRISAELISLLDYGSISVSCNQREARIFLNGSYQKMTSTVPVLLEDLEDGYYELVIIKDGFRVWVGDIEVYPGEVTSVNTTLSKIND